VSQDVIVTERPHEHVALVRLNRPKVLNAISNELITRLADTFQLLDADGVTRAIVLTGDDRAFAAGAAVSKRSPATSTTSTFSSRAVAKLAGRSRAESGPEKRGCRGLTS